MMRFLLSLALFLVFTGCDNKPPAGQSYSAVPDGQGVVQSNPPPSDSTRLVGRVSQPGLYKLMRSAGVVNSAVTSTGKAVSKPVIQLLKSTERIPLVKGAQMYLQYRIWSLPEQPAYVELRRVVTHPPMRLPDGSVSTGSDFMIRRKVSAGQVIAYTGYGFDEDYELLEGQWSFEIWYQDTRLIRQTFTTYRPGEEELAALKSSLMPNAPPSDKLWSRFDWPSVKNGLVTYPHRGAHRDPP